MALAHALVVAPHYHVGSFDDDASYVLGARAVASGAGLTTRLTPGFILVAAYPPGFAVLLAPLVLVFGHSMVPLRGLVMVCFVAVFPLTWRYLDRRGVTPGIRLAVLGLLALNPVLATFGSMVMPETAFIAVLLIVLMAADRWLAEARTATWAGVGTLVGAAALPWLKEAGIGLVAGLALWFALNRAWRKALLSAVIPGASLVPVLLARASAGVPLIGARYSTDLGGYYPGGLASRIVHVVPHALSTYFGDALPWSIVPTEGDPLPGSGPIHGLILVLRWTAVPLILLGLGVWVARHRDAAAVAVPFYLAQTLVYPFINERRVVLVLPVVLVWYAIGAVTFGHALVRVAGNRVPHTAQLGAAVLATALLFGALIPQFPRNYRLEVGEDTSAPKGSPYMAFLRSAGAPLDVVETDYLSTTALFSGHRTANGAFSAECAAGPVADAVASDHAGYLLSAALNLPGLLGNECLFDLMAGQPWAVRLYRTERDEASVFELVGPRTAHPDLIDLVPAARLDASPEALQQAPEVPQSESEPPQSYPAVPVSQGVATLTWSWNRAVKVRQISVGAAGAGTATTQGVELDLLGADGVWRAVRRASGPVGPEAATAFFLVNFPVPVSSIAVRVTVRAAGTIGVHDLHVLGSAP